MRFIPEAAADRFVGSPRPLAGGPLFGAAV